MQFRPSYPIRTARLALRPYAESDLDAILDIESREEVVRYLRWGPMNRDEAMAHLARRVANSEIDGDSGAIFVAVTIPPDDRVIGDLMLRLHDEANRQGEIGWIFHPDVHGRGYATEAAAALLRMGFESLGLHRIIANADPRNVASHRVMERLGMRREGEFRDTEYLKGEWVGAAVYAILDDEWRRSHPG